MSKEADEIREAFQQVIDQARQVPPMPYRDSSSTSTITVQGATGWQVIACLLLAVIGMMCGAFGLYIADDTREEQRDTSAHLETIYMLIPDLRKRVEETLNNRKER